MFNSKKFFIGISYQDEFRIKGPYSLNRYSPKFLNHLGVITGYTFKKSDMSHFSFNPILLIGFGQEQWKEYPINIYLTFKYKKIIAGLDMYTNLMVGYESSKFRFMLVQRFPLIKDQSTLFHFSGYSAQLSLQYNFGNKKSNI